jgi:histidinol-phosphate/aromatic aminotransferase/cobyric acid decarboxylase-like protein
MKYSNHGANPDLFYKSTNLKKPKEVIDFSTNTNIIIKSIKLNINKLAQEYPDYTHHSIKNILSTKHNIKHEEIIVTNGINEVIYLLSNIYKDKKVALLKDDYTEYKRAFKDTEITYFNNIYEVNDVDILLFSNPNNPSGLYEDVSLQISKLSKTMTVIVDESYIEFIEDKKHHYI